MGTTDTALRTGSGQFGFALLIEGYPYIICDAASTAPVVTAYAGTDWEQALAGLRVIGLIRQSIEPLKENLDVPTLTMHVMDCDGNDTFGKAVWKSKPTISSRLTAVFEPADDGSGSITVKDNATGPAAFGASGQVFLGNRTINYSSKSGSTGLVVSAGGAGVFAPFSADGGNVYNRPQGLAEGQNWDTAAPPRVSNVPQTWKGKMVALYVHRIVGGVWDTRAQAHLEFAGTISEIEDGEGITSLTCVDLRKKIEDTVLLRNQWTGYIKPGIRLRAGDKFKVEESPGGASPDTSGEFTVVASGASGDDEANAGVYEYGVFLDMLIAWLDADGSVNGTWSFTCRLVEQGYRTRIRAEFATTAARSIAFYSTSPSVLEYMGFTDVEGDDAEGAWCHVRSAAKYRDFYVITSPNAPYRIKGLQRARHHRASVTMELDSADGVWFDHGTYLPAGIQGVTDGDDWSYVIIGDKQLAIATYSSDTELVDVTPVQGFGQIAYGFEEATAPGVTFDDSAEYLTVRQVVLLTGRFSSIIPKLFASLGGAPGVNHASHDVLPWGAGMPWGLLGETFENSCASLETTDTTDTISVRLVKPTKLADVLIPEMMLRFAFLIFKDGGYQFVSPSAPNAVTATHTLDETNKATGPAKPMPMTSCRLTSEFLTNVIKIEHKPDHTGKFLGQPYIIKDEVSIGVHGETDPVDIDAVNSVNEDASISGTNVESLAGGISARLFPMFGSPVKVLQRTIAPSLFHVAPGDSVALSDDLVRDPTSGERRISGRACTVLSSQHDYAHEGGADGASLLGEVTLLMSDEDRTFPLSPAAEIDTTFTSGLYTNGYDSTNFRLKLKSHSFSKSTDALDVTHLDNGDLIRIVELDPANPASIDAWSRTLHASAGIGADYLQMTASLSSPSWSGATKKFVVIPQAYASAQASQKLHAFQADDADGHIQDVIEPNSYGTQTELSFNRGVATDLPALLADEVFGDGKPVTPFQLQYLTRMMNNLINYKTANHRPDISYARFESTGTVYGLAWFWPVAVGGLQVAGRTRYLTVAPMFKSSTGAAVYVKVTSSRFPPNGPSRTSYAFSGPTRSVEFTTTSTSYVVATSQDLLPIPAQFPGHTWLTVQVKATSPATAAVYGLPILKLKAIG